MSCQRRSWRRRRPRARRRRGSPRLHRESTPGRGGRYRGASGWLRWNAACRRRSSRRRCDWADHGRTVHLSPRNRGRWCLQFRRGRVGRPWWPGSRRREACQPAPCPGGFRPGRRRTSGRRRRRGCPVARRLRRWRWPRLQGCRGTCCPAGRCQSRGGPEAEVSWDSPRRGGPSWPAGFSRCRDRPRRRAAGSARSGSRHGRCR
ncbi:hypothetical protein D3C81_1331480 [compost metagenome]